MPSSLPFIFGLGPDQPPITEKGEIWSAPIPTSRHAFAGSSPDNGSPSGVTYGDYFSAARRFLTRDDSVDLRRAIGRFADRPVRLAELEQVAVYLVKHGAYYHPSYIKVEACGKSWPFVLNVAIASRGQAILSQEVENLDRLNRELTPPYWPLVFGSGCGRADNGSALPMFLGQWLEGFHEFHLTGGTDPDPIRMVLWDDGCGHRLLSPHQAREILRQAAFILAYAYNPLTFEGIQNWHHAAGDFVAHPAEDRISVRLITVRKYAPLFDLAEPDAAALLEALLIYLVDISLRLRVDRLDGTGQLACHPADSVPAICQGFLAGLDSASALRGLPLDFGAAVRRFLALHGIPELMSITRSVLRKNWSQRDEAPLLHASMEAHVASLAETLAGL